MPPNNSLERTPRSELNRAQGVRVRGVAGRRRSARNR
jgi:hypothetical protein